MNELNNYLLADKYRKKFVLFLLINCLVFVLLISLILVLYFNKEKLNLDTFDIVKIIENYPIIFFALATLELIFDIFLVLTIVYFSKLSKLNKLIDEDE